MIPGRVLTDFGRLAIGAESMPPLGNPTSGPAAPHTAEAVAAAIDEPRAEVYTNPMHPDIARAYVADPVPLEAKLAPRR